MKGTLNFIIQLDNPYKDKFKTKGGFELYGNVDFTAERQSNRVAKVIGTPALFDSDIKEGYEILIDFSSFYRQIYQGTKQYYQNVVDADKNLYYLMPNMIICFRENTESEWKGFGTNCLVKPIFEEKNISTTLILPNSATEKKFTGKVTMTYANTELQELGVENNDTMYMDIRGGVKYWFEGQEYWWVRNKDLYAKENVVS